MINRSDQRAFSIKFAQFIWLIFGIIEGTIGLRFLLKLIGANPGSAFVTFIYAITEPLLWPFRAIVGEPQAGQFVLEVSTLIAIAVYALLAWALVKLTVILFYPVRTTTDTQPIDQDRLA